MWYETDVIALVLLYFDGIITSLMREDVARSVHRRRLVCF